MKKLWAAIVLAVLGATVATLLVTQGEDRATNLSVTDRGMEFADLAPPDSSGDSDETVEAEPSEASEAPATSARRPISFGPTPDDGDDSGGRQPRGASIDVTEGEFAESSEGEDELEAEREAEEEEAEREAEEDEEKAERRADRERNHNDDN